ncbi:hypothetical protein H6501_04455 [Candidatus Woesearchaeota archaeon]|nr:hypothetical protein [Candidatus Woesearchaeota archaeon]USN43923.1 MAG: hypothetical protein H6500_06055 [Candidatus Woesearchaeota archaeon]
MNNNAGEKRKNLVSVLVLIFTLSFFSLLQNVSSVLILDNSSQIYASTQLGQDGTNPINVTFDSETIVQTAYTHSSSQNARLYINETGVYKLSYSCTLENVGATNRVIMEGYLQKNNIGEILPSRQYCYVRDSEDDRDKCALSASTFTNLSNGDFVELEINKFSGSAGSTLTSKDCYLYAQKVRVGIMQYVDTIGAQNYDGLSITTLNLTNQTHMNSSYFQNGTNKIKILQDGLYKIYTQVCTRNTAQANRQIVFTRLQANGSSEVPSSRAYTYIRQTGTGGDRNCAESVFMANLSSGTNISLLLNKSNNESTGASVTLANMSWLSIEKIESETLAVYEETGGQIIADLSSSPISFDKTISSTKLITALSTSQFKIEKSGFYEISYTLNWDDLQSSDRVIACAFLQINSSEIAPASVSCDYSRGISSAHKSGISETFLLYLDKEASVELLANTSGSLISILPHATSLSIIKLEEAPEVNWEESFLEITGEYKTNEAKQSVNISAYQNNTDITISCISGNCSLITINVSTSFNLSSLEKTEVLFTCNDSKVASYSAVFSLHSTEDPSNENLNVSCNIFPRLAQISPILLFPLENQTLRVPQNKTFSFQSNISCSGLTSNTTCGNVTVYAQYNAPFGSGEDGALVVSSLNTTINTFTYLLSNSSAGNTILQVNDSSLFAQGDEILIIQMQNGSGGNYSAGTYEIANVQSSGPGILEVKSSLSHDYGSGEFDKQNALVTQIVKIPQFTNVTINSGASLSAPAWNGYGGGIVIFRATGTLNSSGYINVSEIGFRGGDCAGCGNGDWGKQGEGYLGLGTESSVNNGNGGGGGYGPSGYGGEPAAGGGHAGQGTDSAGSFDAQGGESVGNINLSTIHFGGGGGAGGDNDGQTPYPQYISGGGIAIVLAKNIVNARVEADGKTGLFPGGAGGTAGSGAGGSILLVSENLTLTDVHAKGGPNISGSGADIGGAGADGRIRLIYNSLSGSTDPNAGSNDSLSSTTEFTRISTVDADTPLFTSSLQGQSCVLNDSQSCLLNWTVNATGLIGSSIVIRVYAISNYSLIAANVSANATINITNQTIITLLSPANTSKSISNGTISFNWTMEGGNENQTCTLYINNNASNSSTCLSYQNNSMTLTLGRGYYSWKIESEDSFGNKENSSTFFFYVIKDKAIRVIKKISSINTDLYATNLSVENLINDDSLSYTLLDFVDINFNDGSHNPAKNFTNISSGWRFNGSTIGWIGNLSNSNKENKSYALAGLSSSYFLRKNLAFGVE